ncbi:MAG: cation:proton antiporter [Candidatus Krumholzibacteria bacterium]|jgi:Kef-type K+ transport system membrane component KefB|nr:cation:proton antiporter [Candidatus Krumholzibacteria bacterium]
MRTIRLGGLALVTLALLSLVAPGLMPGYAAQNTMNPASALAVEQHAPADGQGTQESHKADHGEATGGGHESPVLPVLALLMIVMLAAKIGGGLMEKVGQPGVLGELLFGVILGNLTLIGFHGWENLTQLTVHFPAIGGGVAESVSAEKIIEILGEIGVILLLFQVGLESNIKEMLGVGASSFLVAILGVVAPFLLGWGVGLWLIPEAGMWVRIFLGATLAATSVGITARVLKDLGRLQARESKIVLGAAVIDDVMGLVVLAVVVGLIGAANNPENSISTAGILWIIGKALLFLVLSIVLGQWGVPKLFKLASQLKRDHLLLTTSLLILFFFSYVANRIGLATIVGAFAAGLVLEPVHFRNLGDHKDHDLEELLAPLASFLVPIFFVRMGYMVDLTSFANTQILGFAAALTVAAIIGKQICSLGVLEKGLDRLSVGIGMIPRGEVGLIFAGIGAGLVLHGEPVVSSEIFSAVIIMVIVTTLITPPILKWSLNRPRGYEGASDAEMLEIRNRKRQKRASYYRGKAEETGESGGQGNRNRGRGRSRRGPSQGRGRAGQGGNRPQPPRDSSGGEPKEGVPSSGQKRRRRRRRRRSSGGSSGGQGPASGGT